MRDPNRLYKFYEKLQSVHITYFPDWRFGQLMVNFQSWLGYWKGIKDMFYIEEDKFLILLDEYVKDTIPRGEV